MIINYDLYRGNVLPHSTALPSELKGEEIKVRILGTKKKIFLKNVPSGRNDYLEPSRMN